MIMLRVHGVVGSSPTLAPRALGSSVGRARIQSKKSVLYVGVAKLVRHQTDNLEIVGPSPTPSTSVHESGEMTTRQVRRDVEASIRADRGICGVMWSLITGLQVVTAGSRKTFCGLCPQYRGRSVMVTRQLWELESRFESDVFYHLLSHSRTPFLFWYI